MKYIILFFCLLLSTAFVKAQPNIVTDTLGIMPSDTTTDTSKIELIRIYPEPFHDYLVFQFKVHDTKQHRVKISIMDSMNELVFFESVFVYDQHTDIRINTVDFFLVGLYSIQIEIDQKFKQLKKFKRY